MTATRDRRFINRSTRWRYSPLLVVLLVTSACASESGSTSDAPATSAQARATAATQPSTTTTLGEPTNASVTTNGDPSPAATTDGPAALPAREGPRERTTESVPHVQLDAEPVPEVDAELRLRAFSIPEVEDTPSEISRAGARALWISADVELARPDVLLSGREFAHIHPDGSLHVWLPVERAIEVDETGWGELHPWVDRDDFWDGVVMVFTPQTLDEVDTVIQLLVESYNLVTGLDVDPSDF